MAAKKYKVLVDLYDADGNTIALAGEDIAAKKIEKSVPWLLEQGCISEEVV